MRHNKKAFTLVEMLVALAVSAVIISATYASFELIKNQYKRNTDISQLHSSGRAIMQVLEREIRMAGYEFRDGNGVMTYGKILEPLVITDSGDSCCDEVTIVYDEVDDTLNAQGVVTSSQVQRIQTRFWTEAFTSNKRGDRFRLFKRRTILGQNNALLPRPTVRPREVMADYIEDLQLNYVTNARLYAGFNGAKVIQIINPSTGAITGTIANTSQASALAVSSTGLLYAGFNGAKVIQIINPSTGAITGTIANTSQASALAVSSTGDLYAGFNGAKVIQIINPSTAAITGTIANTSQASALAVSSSGDLYAGFNGAKVIQIINPSTGAITGTIANTSQASALDFSILGRLYAGFNGAKVIQIINPSTGAITGTIANTSQASALAFLVNKMGNGTLININIALRSREGYGRNRAVNKQTYHAGNFNFIRNDQFQRDVFESTVAVRNL
jgi:prepilin-type N-terminal cleavage/methylation domain-containing protein